MRFKRLLLLMSLFFVSFSSFALRHGHVLVFAFSSANAVYEDDKFKMEFYGNSLFMTNKTNTPLYIDPLSSFCSENEYVYNFSRLSVPLTTEAPIVLAPKTTKCMKKMERFGQRNLDVRSGTSYGKYRSLAGTNVGNDELDAVPFNQNDRIFLNVVDNLYRNIGEYSDYKADHSSAFMHITENESFLKLTASVSYSTNSKLTDAKRVAISSWVSDVVLAKSLLVYPKMRKQKGVFISDNRVLGWNLHVFANLPFNYDEEKSPFAVFHIEWDEIKKAQLQMDDIFNGFKVATYKYGMNAIGGTMMGVDAKTVKDISDAQKLSVRNRGGGKINIVWDGDIPFGKDGNPAFGKKADQILKAEEIE